MPKDSGTTKAQATNIDAVVRLEAEDEERVSHINRLSGAVASFADALDRRAQLAADLAAARAVKCPVIVSKLDQVEE